MNDKMTLKYFNDLAYEEIGEENDEVILFLHTKLLDKWIWIRQKEGHDEYFNDFHSIFLDLPHHGESKSEGEFSIKESSEEIMEFIQWLVDSNGIDKINIVSLGLGSSIAIEILSKNPQFIGNLILSGPEISDFKEEREESVVNRLAKTQSEHLNAKPDQFIVKAYLRYYGISKEYYDYMERILDRPIKEEKEIAFESLNYTLPKNITNNKEILEKENILIIYGTKEDLNCTKSAIRLKGLFKNGKLIEINKGNHLWNIIDHELFNTIASNFIRKCHIEKTPKIKIL